MNRAKATRATWRQLEAVQLALGSANIVADIRESARGVPHLLVMGGDGEPMASVAWFGREEMYRVFWPWPSNGATQSKRTHYTPEGVSRRIQWLARNLSPAPPPAGWEAIEGADDPELELGRKS
jgi:hypothetical protein